MKNKIFFTFLSSVISATVFGVITYLINNSIDHTQIIIFFIVYRASFYATSEYWENQKMKSIFKEYYKYLKDNPEGYWFKRKLYGWGWTPARWQGWAVTLAFIAAIIINGLYLANNDPPSSAQLAIFFASLILAIILLITICYKTGEKPEWTWGNVKKN